MSDRPEPVVVPIGMAWSYACGRLSFFFVEH